jgi:phosphoheptose isomerase
MGNGGSLCDALHFSVEFTHPIIEKRKAFPVLPLMTYIATLTAVRAMTWIFRGGMPTNSGCSANPAT